MGVDGGPGNRGDPFTKRLNAFSNIGVVQLTGNEGPIEAFKWRMHA